MLMCEAVDGPPPVFSRAHAKECGDRRYFTGKPCPHGHIFERNVSGGGCCECARVRALETYHKNPEESRARAAAYRAANPDKVKQMWASYYDRNGDYLKEARKEYHRDNREVLLEKMKKWKAANKELLAAYQREWRIANRCHLQVYNRSYKTKNARSVSQSSAAWRAANADLHALYERNRRARLRNAEGSHTKEDVDRILKAQRYRCAYCRCSIRSEKRRHIDHMKAVVNGGSNLPRNLQAACNTCNTRKGKKSPEEFARIMGLIV